VAFINQSKTATLWDHELTCHSQLEGLTALAQFVDANTQVLTGVRLCRAEHFQCTPSIDQTDVIVFLIVQLLNFSHCPVPKHICEKRNKLWC